MLQFVFVACMTTGSLACREVPGPVFGGGILHSVCLGEAPKITEAWVNRNPGWTVRTWRCRVPGDAAA